MKNRYLITMKSLTIIADSEQEAMEMADDVYSDATHMQVVDMGTFTKRKFIKLAFEIDYQEGSDLTKVEFAEAISEGLPKEYWTDNAVDTWGIVQIFPLHNDGRLMTAHL